MKTYDAVIHCGGTTKKLNVLARFSHEAIDQAILECGQPYARVYFVRVTESMVSRG